MLEYLQELIEGILAEFDGSVDLSKESDRELVTERLLESIQEEYLTSYTEAELQDEMHRLHDENDSLWEIFKELKELEVTDFTSDLKQTIITKLVEVKLKSFNRTGSGWEN